MQVGAGADHYSRQIKVLPMSLTTLCFTAYSAVTKVDVF
jgi:hypothetical protein